MKLPNPDQPELSAWLYANPARVNLGRIGLELTLPDGRGAVAGDLTGIRQELDPWSGIIDSTFELAGEPVHVRTCCHPDHDTVAVEIDSPLVAAGQLKVFLDFPYADGQEFAAYVGNYGSPDAHTTTATARGHDRADITHRMDSTEYHVALAWEGRAVFTGPDATAAGELVVRTARYGTDGWRERLGLHRDPQWQRVHDGLAPLPVQDGTYVLHEGVQDMWTQWNYEHPALIGLYGWLPGDGVDVPTMARTADKVFTGWQFDNTWGWDFPMLAMCAARLGRPDDAVDFLLHPADGFQFDDAGLATGGPFSYFPSNAALLYAIAFMAAGWDGAPDRPAPGFPADKRWVVRFEGLSPAL